MKKQLLVIALVTGLVLGLGATAAQGASVEHELEIVIPAVLMIRFVSSAGAPIVAANPVVFAPTAAAITAGTEVFAPVSTALNWANIEVFANTRPGGFEVTVATNNDDFEWDKVSVTPAGGDLAVVAFDLPANDELQIYASGSSGVPASTGNQWQSLGISPASYVLTLDGSEEEGTDATTVTYTIADL